MWILNILLRFSWLFRPLLYLLVRSRAIPDDFEADRSKSTLYVLRTRSFSDWLVLDYHCKKMNLPRPIADLKTLFSGEKSTFVYLSKVGILSTKRGKTVRSAMETVVELASRLQMPVDVIPVSIFWGRDPGSEQTSWIKLLFLDTQHGGVWQKFCAILIHGRSVFCNFGRPIDLASLLAEGQGVEQTTRKLNRNLRVFFHQQAIVSLGPLLYDRKQVLEAVVKGPKVQAAIDDLYSKKGHAREKYEKQALKCAEEIASHMTHPAVLIYEKLLHFLWSKLYKKVEINGEKNLMNLGSDHSIVYVPNHRSHMDYLLICYVLFNLGYMSPHTAAGINLNFFPVGFAMRRGGAFFMRRSFKGDRLYAAVFSEYVHYLLTKGYPINFFPEGGRSRTGRLLAPKTGMYSMVFESQLRNKERPVVIVPISINYDKIVEGKTYEKELSGGTKQSESILTVLENFKILRESFGKVYVSVGKPLILGDYLNQKVPDWGALEEVKSSGLSKVVTEVAQEMMVRVNQASVLSPTSLLAAILLASKNKAIPRDELGIVFQRFWSLLEKCSYDSSSTFDFMEYPQALEEATKLLGLKNFKNIAGDIIYIEQRGSVKFSYYRNCILHFVAIPGAIAQMFQNCDVLSTSEIKKALLTVYPWLKRELFLKWHISEMDTVTGLYIDGLVEHGLLDRINEHEIRKPHYSEQGYSDLTILADMISSQLQLYGIGVELLADLNARGNPVNRDDLENILKTLMERTAMIQGDNLVNLTLKEYLPGVYGELKDQGVLVLQDDGSFKVGPELAQIRQNLSTFIPPQLKRSILGEKKERV
jgi:glycerol-3-phosphate O-acyltransferase